MSDFSFFSLFTAGLACLSVVNAYTQPKGDAPEGNPISEPGLNSVVPAGEPFTVTWEPTTQGTVTLVLLKGPSTDAEPQYALIEKTPNTGTFVWTPKTDLAPSDPSTPAQGYGIQLIDDATGQYQYTTQFGISNPDYKASSSSSSSESSEPTSSETKSASGYKTTEAPVYTTTWVKDYTTVCPEATKLTMGNHTYTVSSATTLTITDCSCTITKPAHSTTPVAPVGTGSRPSVGITPAHNVTMVAPTGYVPTSLSTSATYNAPTVSATPSSSIPVYKGAASTVATSFAGLIIAAGAVVLAL